MARPPISSNAIRPATPAGPSVVAWPVAIELARITSSTVGASFRPDSASNAPRSRCGIGTWRSTEKTAAASVGEVTAPSSTAIQMSSPST